MRAFLLPLRARSGIDFTQYKSPTVKQRTLQLFAFSLRAGQHWKDVPKSVALSFGGTSVHYRVSVVALPGEPQNAGKLVVLSG